MNNLNFLISLSKYEKNRNFPYVKYFDKEIDFYRINFFKIENLEYRITFLDDGHSYNCFYYYSPNGGKYEIFDKDLYENRDLYGNKFFSYRYNYELVIITSEEFLEYKKLLSDYYEGKIKQYQEKNDILNNIKK